jgi:hypothetical protein
VWCVCLLSLKHSMCLIKCLMDFVGSKFAELFDWLQLMSSELTLLFADRHFVCKILLFMDASFAYVDFKKRVALTSCY